MSSRPTIRRAVVPLLAALLVGSSAFAQQPKRIFTAADYDRAARYLGPALANLVIGGSVSPAWLPDDRFYYRNTTAAGEELILVDPARRTRTRAFDHARVAAALSAVAGRRYTADSLPILQAELSARADTAFFAVAAGRWACDVRGTGCVASRDTTTRAGGRGGRGAGGRGGGGGGRGGAGNAVLSPDGKRAAFIRDWNLWVRDVATGQERQLTTDGAKDFGYATDNAGWVSSDRAILLWSPDSRKIATQQQDERNVGEMYLVETRVGHPVLKSWKYPLPGDSVVAMLHRVIIDVDAGRVTRLQLPPEYHRATLGDNISMNDYNWSPDASKLALVSTSRDHKQAIFRVADAATGAVQTVFEETVPTHYESRTGFRMLWPTNEVIWYSQRDDWGHLYLYDLTTGKLKNRITSGDGPVSAIARVDERTRTVWFTALGREPGQDPYFRHFYRIGLDGKGYTSLTPDDGDHAVDLSPSGRYLVDTYSKPDVPAVVTLRDASGKLLMPLEKADISKLLATGWKPPIPFTVKSSSGKFDLYGQMFRPTSFDSTRKYPIINNPYPGPQSGSVGSRSFTAARGDRHALAELGFIVITLDGTGTPGRSKAFHDGYYGAMGRDNTIPDQVAGMKQLAARHPWIDIDRVGIWGHSGGGFITAGAMFRYPDFFDVGISESGNHDQRQYEDDWGERYQGLLTRNADGTDNYEVEANQLLAKNLKGKLLLAHGLMDNNVPPYNTWLVVDALVKANKDFDLLMFPYAAHGFGAASNYMMRRRWDYFVTWLLDATPPKEYEFRPAPGGRGGGPP
jgi:dipeptidyl aminopeptidase/acylaminoacyl peptidase